MRAFRRKTVEYDPVWCFQPRHVHYLLECIHDYWSNMWGLPPSTVPTPSPRKGPKEQKAQVRAVNEQAKQERMDLLTDSFGGRGRQISQIAVPGVYDEQQRYLYASILQRAVLDWTDNCVSAYQDDQRVALSAYWWIMGVPYPQPRKMSFRARLEVARGRIRRYMLPDEYTNPLPLVDLPLASLWIYRTSSPGMPIYFPADEHVTFLDCCANIDVDPEEVRRGFYLIPPQN